MYKRSLLPQSLTCQGAGMCRDRQVPSTIKPSAETGSSRQTQRRGQRGGMDRVGEGSGRGGSTGTGTEADAGTGTREVSCV